MRKIASFAHQINKGGYYCVVFWKVKGEMEHYLASEAQPGAANQIR
jgi:hypothetical protein